MSLLSKSAGSGKSGKITAILIILGIIFLIIALSIGISDNAPGIIMMYFGIAIIIFALVQGYDARKFRNLTIISVIAIPVSVILHNLLEGLHSSFPEGSILFIVLSGLAVIFFLLALIVCPVTLIAGIIGWIKKSGTPVKTST